MRVLALSLLLVGFHGSVRPLPAPFAGEIRTQAWHPGCPVAPAQLRLLTVDYWGFDGRVHRGRLVASARVAGPLVSVFRMLYAQRFPIRRIAPVDASGDTTAAFECRQASPSPCPGSSPTGHWSEHAYGEAVDLNPVENPYTGCGVTRTRASRPYLDRSRVRKGMVTPAVVAAFRSIGWGWGGDWTGVKDYMHFSRTGH